MQDMTRAELAELIDRVRRDRHLSVRGAAKLAEVPAATMQGWLNGRHFPTPALRPRFLKFVEMLGLAHHIHPGLWGEEGRPNTPR